MSGFEKLKVSVTGSCQVSAIAPALQAMLPGARIEGYHLGVNPPRSDAEVAERISDSDIVFCQMDPEAPDPLALEVLRERGLSVVFLPIFAFSGLHPDFTYVFADADAQARGALGPMHSAIIAGAYALGLTPERAVRLFNSYVCSRLGYFSAFEAAKATAIHSFGRDGYDIADCFDDWMAEGSFMHTPNHPASRVVATFSRMALNKSVITQVDLDPLNVPDYLGTQLLWTVYREIAARLGAEGTRELLLPISPTGERRQLPLLEFAQASYQSFDVSDPAVLRVDRVDWVVEGLRDVVGIRAAA